MTLPRGEDGDDGDVPEAPVDGGVYGRKNGGWAKVEAGFSVVQQPRNISPADNAIDVAANAPLTLSSFRSVYGTAHAATHVRVSLNADMSSPVYDATLGPVVSFTLPPEVATENTKLYWQATYEDQDGSLSSWSNPTALQIFRANYFIETPAPTPDVGAPFEAGFYGGMIWNELMQSNASKTLATGALEFTVPDMNADPKVYLGQQLEIRSRENPGNQFKCTVTGAKGITLKVNCTEINGSGTFGDWSVMSRYRLIVSPKSSGEVQTRIKSSATALPLECQTSPEGWRATNAMYLADSAAVYPAAHSVRGLSIGGRADWFIPSRDELEVIARNLKPTTAGNNVSTRPSSTLDYKSRGSFGDATLGNGVNLNSAPPGVAYTATIPAQTTTERFRSGGGEELTPTLAVLLTSSEYSETDTWSFNPAAMQQVAYKKDGGARFFRAIRRSII